MKIDRIDLYSYFKIKRPKGALGYLNVYQQEISNQGMQNRLRPAMIVFPGGGYGMLSDREKEPIAIRFLAEGYNTFTVEYSLAPLYFPTQLIEGCMAVAYVKENAKSLGVDADHVAIIGFSAGGHLCGTIATLFDSEVVKKALKKRVVYARPDAVVFSYAVVKGTGKYKDGITISRVSGGDPELKNLLSVDKQVNKNTPPAFIWTTVDDQMVPSLNSIDLATAYKKAGVSFELHVFTSGVHGLALATREGAFSDEDNDHFINLEAQSWVKMAVNFLKNKGFTIKD